MARAGGLTAGLGRRGELLALRHLRASGLVLIQKNFRCRIGEIDLIMRDNDCLVFVEVRSRRQSRFGSAALSVDLRKQRRIACTAAMFLGRRPDYGDLPVRFDVVGIDGRPDGEYTLQWIKDAFRP